jgi:LysR family transcriptional regulator, salicylic acid-responsive activator of bsdBCD
MDFRQLKYFLTIAAEGQITRAAKRLHMAQPPLSQQLKLLEQELGVQLVERYGRKLKLTEAGRTLQCRAEQIMNLMETTVSEINEHNDGVRGTLAVGTVASTGSALLPAKICTFHEKYPEVYFQLWEGDTNRITDLLETRVIEIGLVRLPINAELYDILRLSPEPLWAAMSPAWSKGGKGPLPLSALKDLPLLLLRRPQQRGFIYEQILEVCTTAGFEPRIVCESADIMTLLTLSESGMGVTIVPESAIGLYHGTSLQFREIIEPSLETTAAVIWLRDRYLSVAARRFIDLFSDLVTPNHA